MGKEEGIFAKRNEEKRKNDNPRREQERGTLAEREKRPKTAWR